MSGPSVFLSYSREDAANAAAVEADLGAAGCDVWRDRRLSGGEDWWNAILERIRRADAFSALVSATSVTSVACARELAYAVQLGRPVLPLRTGTADSVGVLPTELATRQIIDYAYMPRTKLQRWAWSAH